MARVLSCNMNVHTHPDVAPLLNEVHSWAWYGPSDNLAHVKARHRESAMRTLRRFPNAEHLSDSYLLHKRFLLANGTCSRIAAVLWVIGMVWRADRVLAADAGGGWDRVLWACALVCGKLFGKPIYLYSETWYPADSPAPAGLRATVYGFIARQARFVLVPAKVHAIHHARLGVRQERIRVIDSKYAPRPAVQPLLADGIRRKTVSDREPWRLLYIGRIMPLKGLDRLIKTVHSLRQKGYNVRLTVQTGKADQYGGSDPLYPPTCFSLANELLGSDGFEWLDPTPDPEEIYRRSDLLVMPNVVVPQDKVPVESWGRVVEEALIAGLPVVSTDAVPTATELVVNGVNGVVVPWNDDYLLEEALAKIMDR